MKLLKKLIQLRNGKKMTLYNPKDGIPLQLYEDTFCVQLSGVNNTPEHVQSEMSPMILMPTAETGTGYDKNADMYDITKVFTDYSTADKTMFSAVPTMEPTTEYLRAVQGETEWASQGKELHEFLALNGTFDLYVRTRNINGTSKEKHFEITPVVLPTPYQDKWVTGLCGSVRQQNANYTNVNRNNKYSDVYTPVYEPHSGVLTTSVSYS